MPSFQHFPCMKLLYKSIQYYLNLQQYFLQNMEYTKKLGQFKPKFQGKPQGYYEADCKDVTVGISICFGIVVFFFFFCVALYEWSERVSTENLVLVWSIILCIFIAFFTIAALYGSFNKLKIEEDIIKKALEKIAKEKQYKRQNKTKPDVSSTNKLLNAEQM